ncbi:hypothetical protein Hypma_006294 [Hypsizygus marmoreus]|uniref:Uncharacterized protein n=1 Tax=Hypsizygus marmoreus TaxID=39966 RepID=A0A369K1U5_HYPMA|nr:hypothetical protein Hypma_006294 [Hypsizygus marmoreus]
MDRRLHLITRSSPPRSNNSKHHNRLAIARDRHSGNRDQESTISCAIRSRHKRRYAPTSWVDPRSIDSANDFFSENVGPTPPRSSQDELFKVHHYSDFIHIRGLLAVRNLKMLLLARLNPTPTRLPNSWVEVPKARFID